MPLAAIDSMHVLVLVGTGFLAGVLGGLLGIGGGVIMIPAMVIFLGDLYGPESFHVYKLAAITATIVLSLPAVYRHHHANAILRPMTGGIVPLACIGVLAGVLAAGTFVGDLTSVLKRVFGAFIILSVAVSLHQEYWAMHGRTHTATHCPMPRRRLLIGSVVGLPAGFIGGLLGVGGGIWAVPAQRQIFGIRIRNAIANSSVMILAVSIATSAGLSIWLAQRGDTQIAPWRGWLLAACLAPGALIGSWIGSGLTHRLPVRWLRYGFEVLLVVTGVRLLWLG